MKHVICTTKNGVPVHVDLIYSQAAAHIAQNPHLLALVQEALQQINAEKVEYSIEHDMGRPIGYNYVVETTDSDTIIYAQLVRTNLYTRFVKNGKPKATSYLSMSLQRDDDSYELQDIWIGRLSPPRPGSERETAESRPYWARHAFVLDTQPVQSRTITKECPY